MRVKLGDIFNLQMGKTPSRSNNNYWNEGKYNWISIADLGTYEKYTKDTKEKISELAVKDSGIKSIPANTVIMSFKLSIGKTAITKEDIYTNEAIIAFIPAGKYDILPDYFYHFFSEKDWSKETNRAVMGSTLNKATLSNIEISLPPLDEQRKIAAVLDKVSDLIAKRRGQLDKLDLLVKARFVEMFGEYQNTNIHTLKSVCNFIDYRGKTPEKSQEGVPLITAKNIKNNMFTVEPQEFIPAQNYEAIMTRGIPKHNDILFTTEAPLGNVCRIPPIYDKFCVGQRIITMQPYPELLTSEYLEYVLLGREFQNEIWKHSSGSTVKGIKSKLLELLTIPIPPIELQNQFAEFVQQTEQTKTIINQSLEKLETLKKALMQEYFN